jgi:DNA ligase-1
MKPMLAAQADLTKLRYPVLVSPKLDGVRCLIMDGVAMSRNLKPIPNMFAQKLFGRPELNGLDGELIVGEDCGPGVFQRTSSGVMSEDGEPPVWFHVFDDYRQVDLGFKERFLLVKKRTKASVKIEIVEHVNIMNEEALLHYEAEKLSDGYEGVMIRDPKGLYKHGRSTATEGGLLKLKRFVDSEAVIIGFSPLMHNGNEAKKNELGQTERSSHQDGKVALDLLGSLEVRDLKSGVKFELGTGFNAEQRKHIWTGRKTLKGKFVKYKSQLVGVKDKPRFPVFIGFRDVRDL